MKLLLCEDERDLSNAIKKILELNKYEVDTAFNGLDGLNLALENTYDGIILDVMMPKLTGIEVVSKLREKQNSTPVLMLTALNELDDKVNGLDAGADDYLTKPFVIKELLARIRALTRRSSQKFNSLTFENVYLNENTFELSAVASLRLTNKEYQIMELFLRNKNVLLSTERIMENVWEFDSDAEINVIWVFISALRKKLEQIGANCTISSVRGVGYKLESKNKND